MDDKSERGEGIQGKGGGGKDEWGRKCRIKGWRVVGQGGK